MKILIHIHSLKHTHTHIYLYKNRNGQTSYVIICYSIRFSTHILKLLTRTRKATIHFTPFSFYTFIIIFFWVGGGGGGVFFVISFWCSCSRICFWKPCKIIYLKSLKQFPFSNYKIFKWPTKRMHFNLLLSLVAGLWWKWKFVKRKLKLHGYR